MLSTIIGNMLRAPQIFFAKNSVKRTLKPFKINLAEYSHADYEKIIPTLEAIDNKLKKVPLSKDGMRWIHEGNTVYFYGQKKFHIPYQQFIQRVDICHAGTFYRDSISVDTQLVESDQFCKAVRQAVRVVALPQPNYAAFLGKGNLDVYKLEKIDYHPDSQKLWMLTVHSPNGSALCDDGYLCFKQADDGQATQVSFLACQNFPPPPLMALIFLDRWQWLKQVLTEDAYRRFFRNMMHNLDAEYHGLNHQVGQAAH